MFDKSEKLGKTEKKRLKEFINSESFNKLGTKDYAEYKRIKELAILNGIWFK